MGALRSANLALRFILELLAVVALGYWGFQTGRGTAVTWILGIGELLRNAGAVRRPLGVSDGLVGKEGEVVTDGSGADEAHGFLVADLAEEALAGPEHDRVDHQPQLVDEVVL
jgi:hypothetical protein